MKYCNFCHRLTPGDPTYCAFCGRTYDVKLCSGKHVNARSARFCPQCGSTEFSTPQPKLSIPKRIGFSLLRFLPGVLLMVLTVGFFFALIYSVFLNQALEFLVMQIGVLLVLLWILYLVLPRPVRNLMRRAVGRPKKGERNDR